MNSGYRAVRDMIHNTKVVLPAFKEQETINQGYVKILDTMIHHIKEMNVKISQLEVINLSLVDLLKSKKVLDEPSFIECIGRTCLERSLEAENSFKANYGLVEVSRSIQDKDVVLLNLYTHNDKTDSYDTNNSLFRIFVEINLTKDEDRFKFLTKFSDNFQNQLVSKNKDEKFKISFSELKSNENSLDLSDLTAEIEILQVLEVPNLN